MRAVKVLAWIGVILSPLLGLPVILFYYNEMALVFLPQMAYFFTILFSIATLLPMILTLVALIAIGKKPKTGAIILLIAGIVGVLFFYTIIQGIIILISGILAMKNLRKKE